MNPLKVFTAGVVKKNRGIVTAAMYQIEKAKTGGNSGVTVRITSPLQPDLADQLLIEIVTLLDAGSKSWEIDLEELNLCNSRTMNLLVKLQSVVQEHSGRIDFKVVRDSEVYRALRMVALDRILPLNLV